MISDAELLATNANITDSTMRKDIAATKREIKTYKKLRSILQEGIGSHHEFIGVLERLLQLREGIRRGVSNGAAED